MEQKLILEVHYYLKDGVRYAFLKKLQEHHIAESCREEEGNLRYEYFLPVENGKENELLLMEEWVSEEAQKEHTKTPHYAVLASFKDDFVKETTLRKIFC